MRRIALVLTLCAAPFAPACAGRDAQALTVGAQEGAVGRVAGELLAQALEKKGLPVTRRFALGSERAVHEALRAGEVDVAVEHTGEALQDVLDAPVEREPTKAWLAARRGYRPMGLEWLSRLGWNDPWVMVERADVARTRGFRSIEELGPHGLTLRLAFPAELLERRDGVNGMTSWYGVGFAERVRVAPGGVADALARQRAEMGLLRASDPRIARDGLVVLGDGLSWFPPNEAAPVIRRDALRRQPKARAALEALAGRVSLETLRRAGDAVANHGAPAAAQARALLAR